MEGRVREYSDVILIKYQLLLFTVDELVRNELIALVACREASDMVARLLIPGQELQAEHG